MKIELSNKDNLEIPEITAGYGSVSWSDYKTGTSCDSVGLPIIESILSKYDDYIHMKIYPDNETMEDIYSKGHEDGWNACLKAIKEELNYWEKENETNKR